MKPNDAIKVKSDLKVNKRYGELTFTRSMEKYLGKRVTLKEQITTNGVWAIKETDRVAWDESMFDVCTLKPNIIQVGIKLLTETAQIPIQANLSDAGRDLYTDEDIYIKAGQTVVIPTGIALDLPVGYFADIRNRSGMTLKTKLRVHLGTIDAGFKGNIGIICENTDTEDTFVYKNTKLAQLVIQKMPIVELVEVKELSDSQRGVNGFGSTDKEG